MSDARTRLYGWLLDRATGELAPAALLDALVALLAEFAFDLHRASIWIPTKHPWSACSTSTSSTWPRPSKNTAARS